MQLSVYSHINNDISIELAHHFKELEVSKNSFRLIHKDEWKEREHNTVDVNPVFVQFLDKNGKLVEKSPNLKNETLLFNSNVADNELFDTNLLGNKIRQIQFPIFSQDEKIGYIIIAMSLEGASVVLQNLFDILIFAYPLILIILFFIARFFAGRSIKPISAIIATSNVITKDNLSSRISLPQNKDELYILSQTINNLLDRIENAIEREKQFTSDASHEIRTPLTVIKGTLEVLIRKHRNHEEYEDKINYCICEVDRLNHLVDQLLLLARFENQKQSLNLEKVLLNNLIMDVIARNANNIKTKNIIVSTEFLSEYYVYTDAYLSSIVINNVLSNALKYSDADSSVLITITKEGQTVKCSFVDSGIGISSEDVENIFNPFFRSNSTEHPEIKGTGLGLSIVKKLCLLLNIDIQISSKENVGTSVILSFIEDELK